MGCPKKFVLQDIGKTDNPELLQLISFVNNESLPIDWL
jgi:hypothetical protein